MDDVQQSGNCIRLWAADCLSSVSVDLNGATQIGKPSHRLPLVSTNWRQFTSGIEVQVLRWSPCGGRLFAAFESVLRLPACVCVCHSIVPAHILVGEGRENENSQVLECIVPPLSEIHLHDNCTPPPTCYPLEHFTLFDPTLTMPHPQQ